MQLADTPAAPRCKNSLYRKQSTPRYRKRRHDGFYGSCEINTEDMCAAVYLFCDALPKTEATHRRRSVERRIEM